MRKLTDSDLEKIYTGWVGKCIGIRYGAPVEMWTAEEIREKYAGKEGYFVDYRDFAADDDSNGPIFFFRALEDCKKISEYGYRDMTDCWLNYVPYEHGFYWWGGYGVSEEHTAYLNLQKGILPPQSGSALQNGKIMAEQIGGQIFSDVWGLVSPHDYRRAADLSEIAARVSHDGAAVDGGRYIAALISAAFDETDIEKAMETALTVIPDDSPYALVVRDMMRLYREGVSQADCFAYIRKHDWKDKYGGNCHIIPNAAIIAYSLLYGRGDFIESMKIANYSGFDTDCNVGNIGTILGVLTSLKGVDYERWIAPLHDTTLCSSVLGYDNIVNIPSFAYRVFRTALRLNGEEYEGKYREALYAKDFSLDFLLPSSTSGMRSEEAELGQREGVLSCRLKENRATVFYKTYYGKADLFDNRYDPAFSPVAYRGQTIRADYTETEGMRVRLFYEDLHENRRYLSPVGAKELHIEGPPDLLISKIGLYIEGEKGDSLLVRRLTVSGRVDYTLDFTKEINEEYSLEHREVRQCTYYKGIWQIEEGKLVGRCLEDGQLFTCKPLENPSFSAAATLLSGDGFGVIVGAEGAGRQTRILFRGGRILLVDYQYGEREIASAAYPLKLGERIRIRVDVTGERVCVSVNERQLLCARYYVRKGCVGAYVEKGSVVSFDFFTIKENQ